MGVIKEIVILLITLSAFVISILTYYRHKTLDNENQLFKYKIEKYNELLLVLQNLLLFFRHEITDARIKATQGKFSIEELTIKEAAIDAKAEIVQNEVILASSFFPDEVVSEIDLFLDSVFADFFLNIEEGGYNKAMEVLGKLEDKLIEISYVMRNDLGIDALHKKLVRRTR